MFFHKKGKKRVWHSLEGGLGLELWQFFFNSNLLYTIIFVAQYYVKSQRLVLDSTKWSIQEDDRLLKIIKKYGTKNWSLVSDKLSIGTTFERTGKQCRERYIILDKDGITIWTLTSIMRIGPGRKMRNYSKHIGLWAASGNKFLRCSLEGTFRLRKNWQFDKKSFLFDCEEVPPYYQ